MQGEAVMRFTAAEVAAIRNDLSRCCAGIHDAARKAVLARLPEVVRVNLQWQFTQSVTPPGLDCGLIPKFDTPPEAVILPPIKLRPRTYRTPPQQVHTQSSPPQPAKKARKARK